MPSPQPLINAAQVAELLGLSMRTIRSMTRRREIPGAINVTPTSNRPTWRYSPAALERWIRRERGPMPEALQNRINAILRTAQTGQRPSGHPETPPRT